MGISTAIATIQIIKHFSPKFWVIENPKTSKIWEFIRENFELEYVENNTYYNNYDNINFSKKPTKFLSNVNLDLLNDNNIKSKITCENMKNYNLRAAIPNKLLLDIYEKLVNEKYGKQLKLF